ncbi:hypothetical protein D3C77_458950 [compost metagenome]
MLIQGSKQQRNPLRFGFLQGFGAIEEEQHWIARIIVVEAEGFRELLALFLRQLLVRRVNDFLESPQRLIKSMYGDAQPLRELLPAVGPTGERQHAQELDFFIEAFFGHRR